MVRALSDLDDLAIFRQVIESGSLRAAARALGRSSTVVSRRVARLEAALDTPLLVRTTRTMRVTPEGERFYRRCVAILDQVDAAEAELRGDEEMRGTLRVAIPTALVHDAFLRRLDSLLTDEPLLDLELSVSDQPRRVFAEGLDLALVVGELVDSSLLARRIGTLTPVMLAHPSYLRRAGTPTRPGDLSTHRCLRFRSERRQTQWVLHDAGGRTHPVEVGGNFWCDDSETLGRALAAGMGIGVRPTFDAAAAIEAGELERVLPAYHLPSLPVVAVYPEKVRQPPALAALLAVLRDAWP